MRIFHRVSIVTTLAAIAVYLCSQAAFAAVTSIGLSDFVAPTIEEFNSGSGPVNSLNFGNGMAYQNLIGESDLVSYSGGYGMGNDPSISQGRLGVGDSYFGTSNTPTTFQLAFAGGVNRFGFFGAESIVNDGSLQRNGVLDLEFYNLSDDLIFALSVATAGTFAWDQFHGFESSDAIGRVVFRDIGHMVLDGVHFESGDVTQVSQVPLPAALPLFSAALTVLGWLGWRSRRRQAAA